MKNKIIEILNEFKFDIPLEVGSATIINAEDFPAIAERIEQLDNWVSVEDRLPEERIEYCLVCNMDLPIHQQRVYIGVWFLESKRFKAGGSEQLVVVTHWQPLPKPKTI